MSLLCLESCRLTFTFQISRRVEALPISSHFQALHGLLPLFINCTLGRPLSWKQWCAPGTPGTPLYLFLIRSMHPAFRFCFGCPSKGILYIFRESQRSCHLGFLSHFSEPKHWTALSRVANNLPFPSSSLTNRYLSHLLGVNKHRKATTFPQH